MCLCNRPGEAVSSCHELGMKITLGQVPGVSFWQLAGHLVRYELHDGRHQIGIYEGTLFEDNVMHGLHLRRIEEPEGVS